MATTNYNTELKKGLLEAQLKRAPESVLQKGLDTVFTVGSYAYDRLTDQLNIQKAANKYAKKNAVTLSDLIALARTEGRTSEQIKNVLNTQFPETTWTVEKIRELNTAESPAIYQTLVNKINNENPDANAYVYKKLNTKGDATYTIRYNNADGKNVPYTPTSDSNFKEDMSSADLNNWYNNSALRGDAVAIPLNNKSIATAKNNAAEQVAAAEKIKEALSGNVGTSANAFRDLTAEDRAAIQAALPGTNNLKAWNQSKDANIFNTIIANRQSSNPDLVARASLKELQDLAGTVSDEQLDITQRNINNQRKQVLQNITRDPELYQAVVQQLRADNAAGTTAGQRASNAQQIAAESDANYDAQAAELYKSMFGGDSTIAQKAYSDVYGNASGAADQYFTSMLNNAMEAARQGQINSQDLQTFLNAIGTAVGVDVLKYANDVAEAQAAAGGNASALMSKLTAQSKEDLAKNDAALDEIANTIGIVESYLNQGVNNDVDTSDAVNVAKVALSDPTLKQYGGGFKTVQAGDYTKASQLDNKQYNDVVNNSEFQRFLQNDTINTLTKGTTLADLRSQFGLDQLTEEGLRALYTGYAEDAAEQSNRVFNAAQRAYIAAVSAGDAKTAEQLMKLASSANSVTKGNLYAASALANQYKQQFGGNNLGSQLSTDFLNQQSFNRSGKAKAALDANSALTKYVGSGNDNLDAGTLYGIHNTFNQTAANNRNYYGQLGNTVMNATQDINSERVKNQINNYDRLNEVASGITDLNALAAANNAANAATKNTYLTRANAMAAQGNSTLKKLNR